MKYRYLNPALPVYKKGDDLAHWLEQSGGEPVEALRSYGRALLEASKSLMRTADLLAEYDEESEIHVDADTHHIGLLVPASLAAQMISDGVAFPDPGEADFLAHRPTP